MSQSFSFGIWSVERFFTLILVTFGAGSLYSQQPQNSDRTGRGGKSTSAASTPRAAVAVRPTPNPQQLERLAHIAGKVLDQIQTEENDLYQRLSYFEKPERLDPSSYASKDEIAQWKGILQQLKDKSEKVAALYADLGKDLDTALKNGGANDEVAGAMKRAIMDGFPWEDIQKKKQLIADFIEEHGKLLVFYEKNWGSWVKGSDAKKPEFTSSSASNIYNQLRDKIVSTRDQIQKAYKAMSE